MIDEAQILRHKGGWIANFSIGATPQKENMEPKNHLFEKGKNCPNLYFGVPC